ncbi:MAG TPA: TauD/TfdA family dioxygenase, partial [Immundisolibacter sp.]
MHYRYINVTPAAGALGAQVTGIDLRDELDAPVLAEIRHAWLQHLVLFFRDQALDSDQYLAFARRIAEPVEYLMLRGLDGYPLIVPVIKLSHERVNFGGL